MKQSAAVAVGVLALGALVLYQRSQRTAVAAVDLSGTTDDLGVAMGTGSGLPAYRGLGHAWARTEPGEPTAYGSDDAGPEPADVSGGGGDASVFANASLGTGEGDTGVGAGFSIGAGGGGNPGPSQVGSGHVLTATHSGQSGTAGGGIVFGSGGGKPTH